MMKFMRHGFFSFVFLAVLLLAGFSLILTDWTGSFRSGVGQNDVARMGREKIGQTEFARLVEHTLRAENIRPDQAYQMGLINQILATEMWQRMLARTAYGYGVAVDDETLLNQLKDMATPIAAQQKTTPAEIMKRFIAAQGMSESAFLATMRREMTNNLIRQAVGGNAAPSDLMIAALSTESHQARTIDYVLFHDEDVTGIVPPNDKTLQELYESRKGEFMLPERRTFRLGLLKRESLLAATPITDTDIAKYYDENKDSMKKPETRRVALATYKTKEAAESLIQTLKKEDDLVALAKKTGTPSQADNQVFIMDDSLPEPMKDLSAAKVGDVLGPIETPFGWSVVRLESITPAGTDSLDQARAKIQTLLNEDKTNGAIDAALDELDKAYESRTPFDQLVKAHGMDITTFNTLSREGMTVDGIDELKNRAAIKAAVLNAAFALTETGRVSPPVEFQNGDIGILIVDAVEPAKPKELAALREILIKDWMTAERKRANVMALQAVLPDLVAGKKTIAEIAREKEKSVETLKNIEKSAKDLPTELDRSAWDRLFTTEPGKPIFQIVPRGVVLAMVRNVTLPDFSRITPESKTALREEIARALREEQLSQYMGALNDRYNAKVNDRLLRQMFAPKASE